MRKAIELKWPVLALLAACVAPPANAMSAFCAWLEALPLAHNESDRSWDGADGSGESGVPHV